MSGTDAERGIGTELCTITGFHQHYITAAALRLRLSSEGSLSNHWQPLAMLCVCGGGEILCGSDVTTRSLAGVIRTVIADLKMRC